MVTSRAIYSAVLAAACLIVLGTRVPLGFERVRFRVITAPTLAVGQSLTSALPDLSPLAGSPAAIVLRLRGAPQSTRITLAQNGTTITDTVLPPNREVRVDASMEPPVGLGHQLLVNGNGGGWQVTYLEIANVHGFSRGILGFDIVPRGSRQFQTLPWWALALMGIGFLALQPRPNWPARQVHRRIYQACAGIVLLLFLAVLTVDRFTAFKILLNAKTAILCIAVLYAEWVSRAWGWTVRAASTINAKRDVWRSTTSLIDAAATRPWMPSVLAAMAAVSVLVLALVRGADYAGGSDPYGYVAQSELLAHGQLYVDQPVVADLPPGIGDWVLVPLGFKLQPESGVPGRIVPTYSPGLPIMMAGLRLLFGPNAVYLVVPVLAGLTVWLTFVLGRDLDGPGTGLFASLWLATSPAFLNSSLVPMSDVPVSAWWLAAFVSAFRTGPGPAAVAGIAASLAVLTRPNLAPLGLIVALPYAGRWLNQRTWARSLDLGMFSLTAAIGPVVVALFFNYWYGSPLVSGYGTSSSIFSWSFVVPNLARYPRWFIESQTPVILAGLAAPFLLRRDGYLGRRATPLALAWLMLALAALVWGCYLGYGVFDAWWYLRFLLPSYPHLVALASATLVIMLCRTPFPRLLSAALLALLAGYGIYFCREKDVFNIAVGEARYQRVGEFVARTLPERSLLLSMQHSGSLRHYARRTTLRYDSMPSDRLDAIVEHLRGRGWSVYIVVDEWEKPEYRARFGSTSPIGKLDWPPLAISTRGMLVSIYDPRDRTSVTPVATQTIP